jgi:hypothetical protein
MKDKTSQWGVANEQPNHSFKLKTVPIKLSKLPALASKYTVNWQAHLKHSDGYQGK